MDLNGKIWTLRGLTLPPIPQGLCEVEVLANHLITARKGMPELRAPVTDEGICKLIKLVYFASLMPEEGRYSRYKIILGPALSLFRSECRDELHVQQIRRLAPACANPDCALLVAERDGSLYFDGVATIGHVGLERSYGCPYGIGSGGSRHLRIDVFGPGHLRVRDSAIGYETRGGSIWPVIAVDAQPPIRDLLGSVQAMVFRAVQPRIGDDPLKLDWHVNHPLSSLPLLLKVLSTAAEEGHGGAFVFLPADKCDPAELGLDGFYPTNGLDLGADLIEQWVLYLKTIQQERGTQERENALMRSSSCLANLYAKAAAVGRLSCVDGCVVLTREFKVLGFGAKINTPVEKAEQSGKKFKNIQREKVYDNEEFMGAIGKTRHQSAARLCQVHPGVLVLTLSQDGDLKLFTSDEQFAYAYGPLHLPTTETELHA